MKVLSKLVKFLSVFAGSCGSVLAIVLFSDYTYPAIGWYIAVCIAITALLVYSYGTILENSIICREILQEQKEKADVAMYHALHKGEDTWKCACCGEMNYESNAYCAKCNVSQQWSKERNKSEQLS